MPFVLMNAPASLQWVLDVILSQYKWKPCLVYLNDVIIFSTSITEHIEYGE